MTLEELTAYVQAATIVYRRGDVVRVAGGVLTVDAFPLQPPDKDAVDCYFVNVGFTARDTWTDHEFYTALAACPVGVFHTIGLTDWELGPSYLAVGGWIGDQTLAFQFMALGEKHHLWSVVTPTSMGFDGGEADMLAGLGAVMVSGLSQPVNAS